MSVASSLKYLASKSERFCSNGPQKYDELDFGNKKANVRLRAHYLAFGGIVCRLTGDDVKNRKQLQELVEEKTEYLDFSAGIFESVSRKCPTWFSNLPALTLYWLILYVVDTELSWIQDCLPDPPEEALQKTLNKMDKHDACINMRIFKNSFTNVFKSFHYEADSYWNEALPTKLGNPVDLPQKLQDCFNQTIAFVEEMDKVFGYAVFRNESLMRQVRNGWSSDTKVSSTGDISLTVPDNGIHLFHTQAGNFMLSLIKLLETNYHDAQGIITGLAICEHLRKEKQSETLSYHGYMKGNETFVRSVGLQIDIYNIWSTILNESKTIIEYFTKKYSLLPIEETSADYLANAKYLSRVKIIRDDFHQLTMAMLLLSAVVQDEGDLYSKLASEFL